NRTVLSLDQMFAGMPALAGREPRGGDHATLSGVDRSGAVATAHRPTADQTDARTSPVLSVRCGEPGRTEQGLAARIAKIGHEKIVSFRNRAFAFCTGLRAKPCLRPASGTE